MALIPEPSIQGLWIAPGKPASGAHALIVGISDYPFLSGGSAPVRASNSGGLGQLEISALTAARIFNWLKEAKAIAGAPVASCRLLLSPAAAELAEINRLTGGNFARPDFAGLRTAIEAWRDGIFAGRLGTQPNTGFFFFSGHGVEHLASPALLAADILDPNAAGSETRAVAIEAVARAVKTSGIDRALFFVDACRNAPALAMTLNIVGQEILKPLPFPSKSPDAVISLQSTRSGLQSFQVPGDPATIFGQALLEALLGPPPTYLPYDTQGTPWRLLFANLESHVKNRVRELLAVHTAVKIQPVEPSGIPYDGQMIVAEKNPAAPPGPLPSPRSSDLGALVSGRSDKLLREFKTFGGDSGAFARPTARAGGLQDYNTMHEILGHESVTDPFLQGLTILDGRTGTSLPTDMLPLFQGRSSEVGDSLTTWLDVEIPPGPGETVWIGLGGMGAGPSFAVAIPRDLQASMPVRLDVGFKRLGSGWAVESFGARLAEPHGNDDHSLIIWRPLWDLQRIEAFSDLGAAGLKSRHLQGLQSALYEKGMSPVGAAIAAGTLIRSGNLEFLRDWPRNLATRFPWLPDGGILWAETILRRMEKKTKNRPAQMIQEVLPMRRNTGFNEARDYFVRSTQYGPPLLSTSLKLAIGQMRVLRDGVRQPGRLDPDFERACGVVERAAKFLVSGSLFASFLTPNDFLSPKDVLGG